MPTSTMQDDDKFHIHSYYGIYIKKIKKTDNFFYCTIAYKAVIFLLSSNCIYQNANHDYYEKRIRSGQI